MLVQTPRRTVRGQICYVSPRWIGIVSRCHVAEKRPNYVFHRAHGKKEKGEGERTRQESEESGRWHYSNEIVEMQGMMFSEKISAGIYRIGKEWSSTTRTFRGRACTETSVRLRTGSRCYLRDAAHGCAHNGETTRRSAHTTRIRMYICTHTVRIYR